MLLGTTSKKEKEDWLGICCRNKKSKDFLMKMGMYDFHYKTKGETYSKLSQQKNHTKICTSPLWVAK